MNKEFIKSIQSELADKAHKLGVKSDAISHLMNVPMGDVESVLSVDGRQDIPVHNYAKISNCLSKF